jgi:hypothetical protein
MKVAWTSETLVSHHNTTPRRPRLEFTSYNRYVVVMFPVLLAPLNGGGCSIAGSILKGDKTLTCHIFEKDPVTRI